MLLCLHLTITCVYINHNNYLRLCKISSSIGFFFKLKPHVLIVQNTEPVLCLKPVQVGGFNTILMNR